MINVLEYTQGNIQVKIDGHRHVLSPAKTAMVYKNVMIPDPENEGKEIFSHMEKVSEEQKQSDLSNELPLIKAVATAVFNTRIRSEGVARFNESTGCVRWGEKLISPEDSLTALPTDIRAFCNAVRTPATLKTFADQKPVEYETDNISTKKVRMVNGAPVLVTETKQVVRTNRVRVKNEDGSDAFAGEEPLFADVPILKS